MRQTQRALTIACVALALAGCATNPDGTPATFAHQQRYTSSGVPKFDQELIVSLRATQICSATDGTKTIAWSCK